jgi:DNA-directed RNA polymerase subunit RPC12/RpoP
MNIIQAIIDFLFRPNLKQFKCPACRAKFKGEVDEEEGFFQCPYCGKKWGI